MERKGIFIKGSDHESGSLICSDGGLTQVKNRDDAEGRTIIWAIDESLKNEVVTFYLEGKDPNQEPPFETPVLGKHDTQVMLRVKENTPPMEWEYNIIWKDSANKDHIYDPKISVLPSLDTIP